MTQQINRIIGADGVIMEVALLDFHKNWRNYYCGTKTWRNVHIFERIYFFTVL